MRNRGVDTRKFCYVLVSFDFGSVFVFLFSRAKNARENVVPQKYNRQVKQQIIELNVVDFGVNYTIYLIVWSTKR